MSSESYTIVFKGDTLVGYDPVEVRLEMAKLLRLEPKRVDRLFSGKQIILKKTTDKLEAAKYSRALKKTGADVKVKVLQHEETITSNSSIAVSTNLIENVKQQSAKQDIQGKSVDRSAVEPTVAPNVGNLFEPIPQKKAPDLNLTNYSLAENDGSFIVEHSPTEAAHVDLSEYSLTESNGANLFDELPNVTADINVPNYGLEAPGALMQTLQELIELVQPNTSGMTLAITGVDLLEENEKPREPIPTAQNISNLNLVPNFDLSK